MREVSPRIFETGQLIHEIFNNLNFKSVECLTRAGIHHKSCVKSTLDFEIKCLIFSFKLIF